MNTKNLFTLVIISILSSSTTLFSQPEESVRRVQVTGTSTITLTPDELALNLSIRHEHKEGSVAVENYESSRTQVLEKLKAFGIPDTTITELGLRFGQFTKRIDRPHPREDEFKELYYAESRISATMYDFNQYPNLMVELTKIPGISIREVSYQSSKSLETKRKARIQAVEVAREKAEEMAAVYNARVGKPLLISENSYRPSVFSGNTLMSNTINSDHSLHRDSGLMVSNDLIQITASVYVEFELVE